MSVARGYVWVAAMAGLLAASAPVAADSRVERNVIYGMYSGGPLLMDVYHPGAGNGHGIIFIAGSGWHAPMGYDARPLKASNFVKLYGQPLVEAGYAVFAINHRAAPRFRYPAAVEDAQRAVRFVRHNAERFRIWADRIGGVGGSSGAHLVSLLGVLDGAGAPEEPDPVNRESARLQCVVARAAPSDLMAMQSGWGGVSATSFMGMRLPRNAGKRSPEYKAYWEASPVNHVSGDDAPLLLIHGDADETVPFEQSKSMERAMKRAGAPVKLLRIPGGGHGVTFQGAKDPPDYIGEMVRWLGEHLLRRKANEAARD